MREAVGPDSLSENVTDGSGVFFVDLSRAAWDDVAIRCRVNDLANFHTH
jgi:hypothetical protein